jgi:hypothetical protein
MSETDDQVMGLPERWNIAETAPARTVRSRSSVAPFRWPGLSAEACALAEHPSATGWWPKAINRHIGRQELGLRSGLRRVVAKRLVSTGP